MAHPSFIDRSFAQMARNAIRRCSYDISATRRSDLIQAAKLKDALAYIGLHAGSSRGKDRRYAIHRINREAMTPETGMEVA